VNIDVFSDIVCPWCLIGKRQLEAAISQYAKPVTVHWPPFQLNPQLALEGMARSDYLAMKFGRTDASDIYARVKQAGKEVGLALNIEAITKQPNTLKGHALLTQAFNEGGSSMQSALNEALFIDYFMHAGDLTNDAHLSELARTAGVTEKGIHEALTQKSSADSVAEEDSTAREAGISGVPFFIFNRKLAVSGAQGTEALLAAMYESESLA
jgi:predicted DsbA family dithiol-disulfide isomerase